MEKTAFLTDYKCQFTICENTHNTFLAITEVLHRKSGKIVNGVKTSINFDETNEKIMDSHSIISVSPISWNMYIDKTKRLQLDFFVLHIPINDYYPMDDKNDISEFYL